MKSKCSRSLLEASLLRCYEASEKKSNESITNFDFKNNSLKISCFGDIAHYTEVLDLITLEDEGNFSIKTSVLLEFVKHSSDEIITFNYNNSKSSCLIESGNKNSKISLPIELENLTSFEYSGDSETIKIKEPLDFLSKLNHASKFCSDNFSDLNLRGIYCTVNLTKFEIKSTNGISMYCSNIECDSNLNKTFILPKKSPQIIKSIFSKYVLNTIEIYTNCVIYYSNNISVKILLENSEENLFPSQIFDLLKNKSKASIKISSHELIKSFKFMHSMFKNESVNVFAKNNNIELLYQNNDKKLAAKEQIVCESFLGEADSPFYPSMFIDCLEAINSSWATIDFIELENDWCLCQFKSENVLILLCPVSS